MPKSKLAQNLNKTDATPTPQPQPETDVLATQIADVESKIINLKSEINHLEQQLEESSEALILLKDSPKWDVPSGQFDLFDQIQQTLAQSQSEEQRIEKLQAMKTAVELNSLILTQKRQQLTSAEQQLLELEEEQDWQMNYEPFVPLYSDSYQFPPHQQSKINQLEAYLRDDYSKFHDLKEVSTWEPQKIKRWEDYKPEYTPVRDVLVNYRDNIIPKRERELTDARRVDQADFRKFIKARTNIEKPLQDLLEAQRQYFEVMQKFLEQAQKYGDVLGLNLQRLKEHQLPVVQVKAARAEIAYTPVSNLPFGYDIMSG
ncbi:hypothetical protein [Brasilonema sp. UFV-L1]|uniref:hypothetical protein n=1 Tax=Brasilonema sp. UFV-L1 TaxID=2234130 RepID=UPI00145F60D6|nr:hypothetical protein [Brasilonema sp. UFV-L1]NMG09872.1 hypothetical protein [Brasilonema sp. UFV-L1]